VSHNSDRSKGHSGLIGVLAFLLVVAALLTLGATSALAARGHVLSPTPIGAKCTAQPCTGAVLETPVAVAVNDATGDVYVLDQGDATEPTGRVVRFSSAGAFLSEFDGSGTLPGEEHAAGSLGGSEEVESGRLDYSGEAALPAFRQSSGLAVDNDPSSPSYGDVYVVDPRGRGNGVPEVVDKFTATGEYIGQITRNETGEEFSDLGFQFLFGVAVDPRGDVWVYHNNFGPALFLVANYSNAQPNVRIDSRTVRPGGRDPATKAYV